MEYELLLDDLLAELLKSGINIEELNLVEERANDVSDFVSSHDPSINDKSKINELFSQATELKKESRQCWDSFYFIT
ncbi:hypothetical protein P7H93_11560 [Lactococcus lactis]|uniref:hypothetical protein n=1 Tax=Lactococcus lactis TaxID=1358 RepID=UPI002051F09B|nr:hypothetical protein [Lactococcus lactis]MDT2917177.1 hypothetical protein [Lactococcus lactis]DAF78684.1 MAG TPA: hypothetical protein [Caudoviricetes sp.]